MNWQTNLVKARSHIIFIIALLLGVTLIFYLERAGHIRTEEPDALAAFDEVVASHGSLDAYLRDALGIREAERERLRELYLD